MSMFQAILDCSVLTKNKDGREGGFTLIEMIIVVAIIGILSAVAIPMYQDYIRTARCMSVIGPAQSIMVDIVGAYEETNVMPAAGLSSVYDNAKGKHKITINGVVKYLGEDVRVKYARVADELQVTVERTDNSTCFWDAATNKWVVGSYIMTENEDEGSWQTKVTW